LSHARSSNRPIVFVEGVLFDVNADDGVEATANPRRAGAGVDDGVDPPGRGVVIVIVGSVGAKARASD
jgi:hypothetical protein